MKKEKILDLTALDEAFYISVLNDILTRKKKKS